MNNPLRAGVYRIDITPELGSRLKGYAVPERVGLTIRDRLNATTLVFEYDGLMAAIITLDVITLDDESVAGIRRLAHEKTGIAQENITICTSHTHSGPVTRTNWGWGDRDDAYMAKMIPVAAQSVVGAAKELVPVRIGIGTTSSDVGVNRRQLLENHTIALGQNPWGPYDREMTVIRIEGPTGTLASLIHYGAHPTVLNDTTRAISRDWPGVMIDRVEHFTKAPALFVNGAAGDVAPRTNTLKAVGDGEAALQEVGSRAGMDAMRAWRSIRELRLLDMATLTRTMTLPYRPLPALDVAKAELAKCEALKDKPGKGQGEYLHWSAVVGEAMGTPQTHKVFGQTITRIGPVVLVPMPGDVFSEVTMRIKHHSPFQHTLCAGYTNGSNGYLVTRDSLARGGYEVWFAKVNSAYIFAENLDDVLFEENLRMLREIGSGV